MARTIKSSFTAAADSANLKNEEMVHVGLLSKNRKLEAKDMRRLIGMKNDGSQNPMLFNTAGHKEYPYQSVAGDGVLYFCTLLVPGSAIEPISKMHFPEGINLSGFRKCENAFSDIFQQDFIPSFFTLKVPTLWDKALSKIGWTP